MWKDIPQLLILMVYSHWLSPGSGPGPRLEQGRLGCMVFMWNLSHCTWAGTGSKSLRSRKSFVLGELSFARMPSRQYCLSMNKLHCYNWSPQLVKCSQWQPYGVVTQHGLTQILGHPKLLQNLNAPQICRNYTFLKIQNLGQSMLGHHTIWLSLAAIN